MRKEERKDSEEIEKEETGLRLLSLTKREREKIEKEEREKDNILMEKREKLNKIYIYIYIYISFGATVHLNRWLCTVAEEVQILPITPLVQNSF